MNAGDDLSPEWEAIRPRSDEGVVEAVEEHLDRFFGEQERPMLHEVFSTLVHIEVHVIEPNSDRDWFTLVTAGMSGRPMMIPAAAHEIRIRAPET